MFVFAEGDDELVEDNKIVAPSRFLLNNLMAEILCYMTRKYESVWVVISHRVVMVNHASRTSVMNPSSLGSLFQKRSREFHHWWMLITEIFKSKILKI